MNNPLSTIATIKMNEMGHNLEEIWAFHFVSVLQCKNCGLAFRVTKESDNNNAILFHIIAERETEKDSFCANPLAHYFVNENLERDTEYEKHDNDCLETHNLTCDEILIKGLLE